MKRKWEKHTGKNTPDPKKLIGDHPLHCYKSHILSPTASQKEAALLWIYQAMIIRNTIQEVLLYTSISAYAHISIALHGTSQRQLVEMIAELFHRSKLMID